VKRPQADLANEFEVWWDNPSFRVGQAGCEEFKHCHPAEAIIIQEKVATIFCDAFFQCGRKSFPKGTQGTTGKKPSFGAEKASANLKLVHRFRKIETKTLLGMYWRRRKPRSVQTVALLPSDE